MSNMAYFNGVNAKIRFNNCYFTWGGFRALFTILINEKPASGNYYPLGVAHIDENGYICVNNGSTWPVVGAEDVADGQPHACEISIDSTTTVVTVTIGSNVYTGTSSYIINEPPEIGGDDGVTMWFKGFLSNYKLYDGSNNLILDLPMTSDFLDLAGYFASGSTITEQVTLFDTGDLSCLGQLSNDFTKKNLGFYFNYSGYHYWCSEAYNYGNCIHVGNGTYYSRSGGIGIFSLPTAIPQGSRITEAYVIFVGREETDSNANLIPAVGARSRITGWKTASPSAFADWTAYKTIRGTVTGGADESHLTDNQVTMDIESGNYGAGYVYRSPSLVNIVQEIVNLGDISEISLFWDDHENRSTQGYGFLADPLLCLIVKYDSATVTCDLTYDANGGTGTLPSGASSLVPDATVIVGSGASLTRTGYDFMGWVTREDQIGTVFQNGDTFTIEANTVMYAKWMAPFTITYNANDADSGTAPSDSTFHSGEKVTVKLNSGGLKKTGHTFRSWNTAADGSGVTYIAGLEYTLTSSMTLYANWDLAILVSDVFTAVDVTANNFVPGFRYVPVPEAVDNTGAGKMLNGIEQAGFAARFVLSTPIPQGATVLSAYLRCVGGLNAGDASGEWTDCYIHAQKNPAPTAITGVTDYEARRTGQMTDAYIDFKDQTLTQGVAFNTPSLVSVLQEIVGLGDVSSIMMYIDDYAGNSGDPNNTSATKMYSIALPVELVYSYACSVSYNGNGNTGGTAPIDSTVYVSNNPVTVLGQNTLTRSGYTFVKWNTAADGSGTDYSPADTFNIVADTTLYAQWAAASTSMTLTYDGNGNTGGTAPVDVNSPYTSGATATVLGNIGSLTKNGCTFAKWNTKADGSGIDYISGNTFTITANTILYAVWRVAISKVVTIVAWDTVNKCGKTGDAANITVRGVRDGVEYAPVAPSVTEVDAANMPGIYTVFLTASENDCCFNTVGGKSSTTGVVIKPTFWRNEEEKESCCMCCCKKC